MTAQQRLDQLGITMQQMLDWLAAQTDPAYVLSVFQAGGFTNEMVGEIAGQAQGYPYSPAQVRAAFSAYGLDSSILDAAPIVVSITSPNVMEGNGLQHTVVLSGATTVATEYSMDILLGSATVSDFSGYSLSNGVSLASFTSLIVPAGVSTFTLTLTSANDTTDEPHEGYSIYIGGVFSSGIITDNDDAAAVPAVVSVGAGSGTEGGVLSHLVTLNTAPAGPVTFAWGVTAGTASLADLGTVSATNGVTITFGQINIPAGVQSFSLNVPTVGDTEVEGAEGYSISVDGQSGAGVINDDDSAPPPHDEGLFSDNMLELLALIQLNNRTGALSNASLKAAVIAETNATDYAATFGSDRIDGAGDGTWSTDELGFSHLGPLPATAATLESLFYGTYLHIFTSIDTGEAMQLSNFVTANQAGLESGDEATYELYVDLILEVMADTAPQFLTDAQLASFLIVPVIKEMVLLVGAGTDIDLFDYLPLGG